LKIFYLLLDNFTFSLTFGKNVFDEKTLGSIYAYFPSSAFGEFKPEPTKMIS
jgi:hypothetical protein